MHRFITGVRLTFYWFLRVALLFTGQQAFALGYVESASVSGGQLRITGWACDSSNRNVATGIHVWRDDNIFLGGGSAPNVRETAVRAACSSTNSNHGFDITIQLSSVTLDNKNHLVKIYSVGPSGNVEQITPAANTNLRFSAVAAKRPIDVADVVGRDLDSRGLAPLGHLGIWDGNQVYEVLNEGGNVVKTNSYENFSARTKVWDPLHINIPNFSIRTCYLPICYWQSNTSDRVPLGTRVAMVSRALQIQRIGADYTATAYAQYARPAMYDVATKQTTVATRGLYRCDTFVLDLFAMTNIPSGWDWRFMWGDSRGWGWYVDRTILGDPQSWKTSINLLFTATTMSPASIYERLKRF